MVEWPTTDVPEHLRFKPILTGSEWSATPPRYMNPREKKPAPNPAQQFKRETFSPGRAWEGVQPRYLQARQPKPAPAPVPLFAAKELIDHKAYVERTGQSKVAPKYLEGVIPPEGTESPRRQIEQQKEKNKKLTGWRSNALNTIPMTFDEIRNRNRKFIKYDWYDKKPTMSKPSVIAEYVRAGTPIRHHTMGSHYVTPKRAASVDGGDSKGWVPGGGFGGGRWFSRANSPKRMATIRENDIISAYLQEAKTMHVSRSHIPRVAGLSSAETFKRWETERSTNSPRPQTPEPRREGSHTKATSEKPQR